MFIQTMFVAKNVGDFGNLCCLVMHIIYVYMHFGLQRTKYLLFLVKLFIEISFEICLNVEIKEKTLLRTFHNLHAQNDMSSHIFIRRLKCKSYQVYKFSKYLYIIYLLHIFVNRMIIISMKYIYYSKFSISQQIYGFYFIIELYET